MSLITFEYDTQSNYNIKPMVNNINTSNIWSHSLTKDVSTKYDEGLTCNHFNLRHNHYIRRSGGAA